MYSSAASEKFWRGQTNWGSKIIDFRQI